MSSTDLILRPSLRFVSALLLAFAPLAMAQAQGAFTFEDQKHVDIRDLAQQGSGPGLLGGTSKWLMRAMETKPELFVSSHIRFSSAGAQGPDGHESKDSQGRDIFVIRNPREGTRKNAVLSVELENVVEEFPNKVFSLRLILFVHDGTNPLYADSNGYYFKRMSVRVDWHNSPEQDLSRWFQVLSVDQEIPLSATRFNVVGDLLERKVILEEKTYGIYKIFPTAVGAFDIETAPGMPNKVSLATNEFPYGKLKKTSVVDKGPYSWNTRSRIYPAYYKGRPFISLFTSEGKYLEIGMHYQITENLIRGFVSHGCIRVRDKDLYQLDAILNEGIHDELSAHFVYNMTGYDRFTHPLKKQDSSYKVVVYSSLRTDKKVLCEPGKYYFPKFSGSYHTVADDECLTRAEYQHRPAAEIIDYLKARSFYPPRTLITTLEHAPLVKQAQADQSRATTTTTTTTNTRVDPWTGEIIYGNGVSNGDGNYKRQGGATIGNGTQQNQRANERAAKIREADRNISILVNYLSECRRPLQRRYSRAQCQEWNNLYRQWTNYRAVISR